MSKLSKEEIIKIADLIKVKLSSKDISLYKEKLDTVLSSIEVLEELNTDDVNETLQTHGLKNVFRDDVVKEGLKFSEYKNRKNVEKNYFKVKRYITQS